MAKQLILMCFFITCHSLQLLSQVNLMPQDNSLLNYGPTLHPIEEQPMLPDRKLVGLGDIQEPDPFDAVTKEFWDNQAKALSLKNYDKLGAIQYGPQDSVNKYIKKRISIFGISTGETIGGYIPGAQNKVPSFYDRLHIRITDLLILLLGIVIVFLTMALIKAKSSNKSK
jgi:hypothetical protein